MKYWNLICTVVLFLTTLLVLYRHSNYSVGIVDSESVIHESLAFQGIQKQIQEENLKLQEEFEGELVKLKPSKEEFELLSEEAKKEKVEQFNKDTTEIRDKYAKKASNLENKYQEAIDNVFKKVKEIVEKIAKSEEINLVLLVSKKNQVLYSENKIDLSDKILKSINKDLPKLVLKED